MGLLPHHLSDEPLDCKRAIDEYLYAITFVYNLEHRYIFGVSPWKDGTIAEFLRQVNQKCSSNSIRALQVTPDDPLRIRGQPGPQPPCLWQRRTMEEGERFWAKTYRHLFVEGAPKQKSELDKFIITSPASHLHFQSPRLSSPWTPS